MYFADNQNITKHLQEAVVCWTFKLYMHTHEVNGRLTADQTEKFKKFFRIHNKPTPGLTKQNTKTFASVSKFRGKKWPWKSLS